MTLVEEEKEEIKTGRWGPGSDSPAGEEDGIREVEVLLTVVLQVSTTVIRCNVGLLNGGFGPAGPGGSGQAGGTLDLPGED